MSDLSEAIEGADHWKFKAKELQATLEIRNSVLDHYGELVDAADAAMAVFYARTPLGEWPEAAQRYLQLRGKR